MTATGLTGRSVFLVEDEVMIRMMVADMLEELGYRIAAEAGRTRSLEELADLQPADVRGLVEAGLRRMQTGSR